MPSYTGSVNRTLNEKFGEAPSVLDWIPENQHSAIAARASTYDATSDIQSAIDAISARGGGEILIPRGSYLVNGLVPADNVKFVGAYGEGASVLKAASAGASIFTWSAVLDNCEFHGITFEGSGYACKSTDITKYTASCVWDSCHFSAELVEGIYANLILCKIHNCRFGLFGTAGAASRHICSIGNASLPQATNINRVEHCRFYHAAGGESIKFSSGYMVYLIDCNVEQNDGSHAVTFEGMFGLVIRDCWFEQNAGTYAVRLVNESNVPQGNSIIDVADTWFDLSRSGNSYIFYMDGASQNLDIRHCGGVVGSTQKITYYNGVGYDFGIKSYRRNVWLAGAFPGAYSRTNSHDEMGQVACDRIQATTAAADNRIAGKLTIGADVAAALTAEVHTPHNDGLRLKNTSNGSKIAVQVLADGSDNGQVLLYDVTEALTVTINGNPTADRIVISNGGNVFVVSATGGVTMAGTLALSGYGTRTEGYPLRINSGKNVATGQIRLADEVTGVLPVANGGTGADISGLTPSRPLKLSSGGAITSGKIDLSSLNDVTAGSMSNGQVASWNGSYLIGLNIGTGSGDVAAGNHTHAYAAASVTTGGYVTLAKLTAGGSNGSLTWNDDGQITGFTAPT